MWLDGMFGDFYDNPNKENKWIPSAKVLVRNSIDEPWVLAIYSHYSNGTYYASGNTFKYCILYEGNENLLGKYNNNSNNYSYKDIKPGDYITIKWNNEERIAIVIGIYEHYFSAVSFKKGEFPFGLYSDCLYKNIIKLDW